MDTAQTFTISCHCGAARQTLATRDGQNLFSNVLFCHCDTCRHTTGLLCTSYTPISSHPTPCVAGLTSHPTTSTTTSYFCSACGCHVFRTRHPSFSAPPEKWTWEVATGVITDAPQSKPQSRTPEPWQHLNIQDTADGGLAPWLPNVDPQQLHESYHRDHINTTLPASCACRSISLLVTRPSSDPSLNPDSPYADLLLPYHSTPPATVSNPSQEKWYLRPTRPLPAHSSGHTPPPSELARTRYLAGTCACQTCRLTSGFEIQTWAFIPRRNILIASSIPPNTTITDPNPAQADEEASYRPLDFTRLPPSCPLRSYESSSGRIREFCGRCGATVFWHDSVRPDLIDVSAGLFREGSGGARAEDWLEWWTGRVSFSEEAGAGRRGAAKEWGEGLVRALEGRLQAQHRSQHSQSELLVQM